MDNKAYKVNGRHGLGTAGRVRRKNKQIAARRVRNGKLGIIRNDPVERATPTKTEIAAALGQLSTDMLNIGVAMEYLGGFDAGWKEKSTELISASHTARQWHENLKATEKKNEIS